MGGNPQKMKKTTLKNQEMIHPNLNYPLRQGKNVQFPFSSLTFKTFDSGLIKATRMMPPELNIPVNTGP